MKSVQNSMETAKDKIFEEITNMTRSLTNVCGDVEFGAVQRCDNRVVLKNVIQ